mgnify:CR=1 FL=1
MATEINFPNTPAIVLLSTLKPTDIARTREGAFLMVLREDADFSSDSEQSYDVPCADLTDGGRLLYVNGNTQVEAYIAKIEIGNAQLINPSTVLTASELEFCRNGQRIQAIKAVRERTRLGLKEAKEMVDAECLRRGL